MHCNIGSTVRSNTWLHDLQADRELPYAYHYAILPPLRHASHELLELLTIARSTSQQADVALQQHQRKEQDRRSRSPCSCPWYFYLPGQYPWASNHLFQSAAGDATVDDRNGTGAGALVRECGEGGRRHPSHTAGICDEANSRAGSGEDEEADDSCNLSARVPSSRQGRHMGEASQTHGSSFVAGSSSSSGGGGVGGTPRGAPASAEDKRAWIIEKFSAKSVVYEQCRLMSREGHLLCHCDRRKIQW